MEYSLKRSLRARHMRLTVRPGGAVILTAPFWSSVHAIERFLREHAEWLERAVARMSRYIAVPVCGRRAYLRHKEEARVFITGRVEFWNRQYGFSYRRIAIKNTKRTWGSCSRKGNLNFSYALLFLPRELADYVVVHEICHLAEHNHSRDFWALVGEALPKYKETRRILRRYQMRSQ